MQCHLKKMPKVRVAAIFLPNITRFKFAQIKTVIWIVEAVNCLFPSSSPDLFSWKGKWKQLINNCFHFHDKYGYFGILIALSFTFLPAKQCNTDLQAKKWICSDICEIIAKSLLPCTSHLEAWKQKKKCNQTLSTLLFLHGSI